MQSLVVMSPVVSPVVSPVGSPVGVLRAAPAGPFQLVAAAAERADHRADHMVGRVGRAASIMERVTHATGEVAPSRSRASTPHLMHGKRASVRGPASNA